MTEHPGISGVVPVLQMPYQDDERIDYETLKKEVDHVLSAGSDGVTLALASELIRLTRDERLELTRLLPEMTADCNLSATVTISVGAETSRDAAMYAEAAEKAGAEAVMAIPPIATPLSAEEKFAYYSAIHNAVTLPLVVQDASGYMGGEKMTVEIMARLRGELGPRIYFKPEGIPIGPTISLLQLALGGDGVIFDGSGGYLLIDSFRRGISGTMPGSDLVRGIVEIWRALKKGNEDRAYEVYFPLAAVVILQTGSLDTFLAVEKHLLVKQGVFRNSFIRRPVSYVLDRHTAAEAERLYDRLCAVLKKRA